MRDCLLSDACFYLCNLQSIILNSNDEISSISSMLNNDMRMEEFHNHWNCFITKGLEFIAGLIDYYSKVLLTKITHLLSLKVADESSILKAMDIYEDYIQLIYQIKLEIDYLDTGLIECNGHNKEMILYRTTMDRSKDLNSDLSNNILKSYIRTNEEMHPKKYSCLSFDGIRVLYTQYKVLFKIKGFLQPPMCPDLLYDPQVENLKSLRAKVMRELCNKQGSLVYQNDCIFYRKNLGTYASNSFKISYGIVRYKLLK